MESEKYTVEIGKPGRYRAYIMFLLERNALLVCLGLILKFELPTLIPFPALGPPRLSPTHVTWTN